MYINIRTTVQVSVCFEVVLTLANSTDMCAIWDTCTNIAMQFCQVKLIKTIHNVKLIGVQHKQPGTESMEGHVG